MEFNASMKLFILTIFMAMLTITTFPQFSLAKCCGLRLSAIVNGKPGISPDLLLINGNSVEKVMLGKSMKEVYTFYPAKRIERVLIYDARGSYEKIEILSRDRSEVLFFIEPDCSSHDSACIIKRINITSATYHTKKNLRVGKYYVDIVKSGDKIKEVAWFEGNLIIRGRETGLSYVMQTASIPKPWYATMDQNTLPDSTKIIGMMISGKDLKGVSYLEVDSLNKKFLVSMALKKLNSAAKIIAVKKTKKGLKKKETLPLATDNQVLNDGIQSTTSASLSLPSVKHLPTMPPQPANQQQNSTVRSSTQKRPPMSSQPVIQQIPATTLEPVVAEKDKSILKESGSDTIKTIKFPEPSTVK